MTVAEPTDEEMAAAWADPKLANMLYHDWEATSYDEKWSISYLPSASALPASVMATKWSPARSLGSASAVRL